MDFDRLYTAYFQIVYDYLLSISHDNQIAEELTQETFFKAMKKIGSFKEGTNAKAWLCQIAKNLLYDRSRHAKHNLDIDDDILNQFVGELCPDVESSLIEKEQACCIHRILHGLEEPYKEVFSLRVLGELSFSDIGDIFGKSEGWVRVTYHRAKCKIREELKNENGL